MDLRWQRGGEPNGFHGLKDSITMKPAGLAVSNPLSQFLCAGWRCPRRVCFLTRLTNRCPCSFRSPFLLLGRKIADYDGSVEWGEWAAEDRTVAQKEALTEAELARVEEAGREDGRYDDDDELDTTIAGPWMKRWDLVHHNRHTANLGDGLHGWGGGALE